MRQSRTLLVAGATLAGLAVGWMVSQGRQHHHRADLFSARPFRRFAALGYLAGRPTVEHRRLLRDYLTWERQPVLVRRAEQILRRFEARLG